MILKHLCFFTAFVIDILAVSLNDMLEDYS